MAGLLPADIVAAAPHLLYDIAVANLGSDQRQAEAVNIALQAEIGHDGRDDAVSVKALRIAPVDAITASIWSPSTSWPFSSAITTRSASPSRAIPTCAPSSRTLRQTVSGTVESHSRLIFRPSGLTAMAVTSAPSSQSAAGAAGGCAVRAIDDNLQTVQAYAAVERALGEFHIAVVGAIYALGLADTAGLGEKLIHIAQYMVFDLSSTSSESL